MEIAPNFAAIRTRIEQAARAAGRDPRSVTLVAASKAQGVPALEAALAAGQRVFGENRVQEAQRRWPDLKARHKDVELHLIGPLQTNKVKDAVALFDVIQSVDRAKLAAALGAEMHAAKRRLPCYVQVNIGREPQKAGLPPEDLAAFLVSNRDSWGLHIVGLMAIPPAAQDPVPHFKTMCALARQHRLPALSLGMSGDYEAAIACGATHVRVGTALFGTRA